MYDDDKPHEIIFSILSSSAKINKLVQASNQRYLESEDEHNFRKKRCATLRKYIPIQKNPEILKTSVRNSIEHFDDRLDKLFSALSKDSNFGGKTLIYKMIINSKKAIRPWDQLFPFKTLSLMMNITL